MPRQCSVCTHSERVAIDAALAAGDPLRNIASRYGMSATSLFRHRSEHIADAVAASQEARQTAAGLDVVAQLLAINAAAQTILRDAQQAKNGELALKAIDRIHRQIELQAKLLGDLDERPQVNILIAPEWVALRTAIMTALIAHPQARQDVIAALASKGGVA